MKRFILFLALCGSSLSANVCTPLSAAASGPFPAIPANGVDGLSWSIARINWTSDATASVPSTQQQVVYATAAEWAASPGVYPHATGQITQTTTASTTVQNAIVSNLLPNTVYHFKGQSYQGGSWCTVSDQTFATLPKPGGMVLPTLPQTVSVTRPTLSGQHWVYGTNCGTTAGTDYNTVTTNLNDCINNHMNFARGDDLALPPQALGGPTAYPISLIYIHQSENAVNITVSGSTFTQASGSAPTNGTQIILGGQVNYSAVPSPINPGVPYYVVNSSGSSFQVSFTSGGSPITVLNAGSAGLAYIAWPITQPRAAIHSTASASQLPPVGVRLGPDALAQYYPYMPNLEAVDPYYGSNATSYLQLNPLTVNLTWENIRFSVDPTVATSTSPVDPVAFKSPIVEAMLSLNGIVWDQCAFDPGAPPTRSQAIAIEGTNIAIINSYVHTDFPSSHLWVPSFQFPTVSGNTITIPAFTWSYVGPSGTKVSCPNAGGTITVVSGTASGNLPMWTNPNCTTQIQAPLGVTVTTTLPNTTVSYSPTPTVTAVGTAGSTSYSYTVSPAIAPVTYPASPAVTIATGNATLSATNYNAIAFTPSASYTSYVIYRTYGGFSVGKIGTVTTNGSTSPVTFNDTGLGGDYTITSPFPRYLYTSPLGGPITTWAALNYSAGIYGAFVISGGNILDNNSTIQAGFDDIGTSTQASEGAIGITMDGYGPFLFDNNYMLGSAIGGVFMAEGLTLGTTVCGMANPCALQTLVGNLTVSRNTMTVDADHWNYDSPNWDGGNRYWRNIGENKNGRFTLWDGNILGPWYPQAGEGQCGLHESFTDTFVQVGSYPPVGDAGDWTYTNNTCLNMPSTSWGTAYTFHAPVIFGYPLKNFLIQNNLALNNNAYAQTPQNMPFSSPGKVYPTNSNGTCPQGILSGWFPQENLIMDHNTVSGQGGCLPYWMTLNEDYPSMTITNNILNLVNDPYFWGPSNTGPGIQFATSGYSPGTCTGNSASTIFPCIHNLQWAGNLMLATWTNSYPGSQVDFTTSQITGTVEPYFSGFATNFLTQNTLALRQAALGWQKVSTGNFRLNAASPFISGNVHSLTSPSTDGLSVGVDMDKLEQHQGKVSNVRVISTPSTSAWIGLYGPDSFACGVDWGTTPFYNGSGTWTRVAGAAGSPDPRAQVVSLSGLPAHGLIYYRVNCAVQQPTGVIHLP